MIKLKSMRSELDISREILASAGNEVEKLYRTRHPEPTDSPPSAESQEIEEYSEEKLKPPYKEPIIPEPEEIISSKKNIDPRAKKIFRRIATKIHPDKMEIEPDSSKKEENRKLYNKAIEALESEDLLVLAEIAETLGMEAEEIGEYRIQLTNQKIFDIKKEIKMIESTMVWHWFFSENPEEKKRILEKLLELMHEKYTRT